MIRYFKHIMEKTLQGIYKGQDNPGLQRFEVNPNTILVRRLKDVEHLNPQMTRNLERLWEVIVQYPNAETLVEGQKYSLQWTLQLKAKYQRGHLRVAVCKYRPGVGKIKILKNPQKIQCTTLGTLVMKI